jgi:two-component system response regulator (stage 0 sporulation protein A)
VDKKIKILIADDNMESVNMCTDILNTNEMEVVAIANDGYDCLEKINLTKPDIVLLDIIMPRLDGWGPKAHPTEITTNPPLLLFFPASETKGSPGVINLGRATIY